MTHQKYDHEISLLHDLMRTKGVGVCDIFGYVSTEFGDPVFKVTRVILNNDTALDVEGEHDMPYIPNDEDAFLYPEESDEV